MRKLGSTIVSMVVLLAFSSLATSTSFSLIQDSSWTAPDSAKSIINPLAEDSESADMGKGIYRQKCTSCHGKGGKGDGPGSAALTPKPADHTSQVVQSQTDGELFWKISEGRGAMTGYSGVLSDEERWDVVNYIRSFGNKQKE